MHKWEDNWAEFIIIAKRNPLFTLTDDWLYVMNNDRYPRSNHIQFAM